MGILQKFAVFKATRYHRIKKGHLSCTQLSKDIN